MNCEPSEYLESAQNQDIAYARKLFLKDLKILHQESENSKADYELTQS